MDRNEERSVLHARNIEGAALSAMNEACSSTSRRTSGSGLHAPAQVGGAKALSVANGLGRCPHPPAPVRMLAAAAAPARPRQKPPKPRS
jgi:hypothetical protein